MTLLATSFLATAAYVVLPYVALAVGIAGLIWTRRNNQFGWTARSTELLEGKILRFASIVFHLGVLAAIGGHVLGILIPRSWTGAVGISDSFYHVIAVIGGLAAGIAVVVGFAALIYRRVTVPRVRVTTTNMDLLIFALLGTGIVTGMIATVYNIPDAVHYRESVAPYFRQIFILKPDASLMTGVAAIFQIHVIAVWFLYMLWPFSRLVHAFSVPINYPRRSPIIYRPRNPQAAAARAKRYGSGSLDYTPSIPAGPRPTGETGTGGRSRVAQGE